MAEPVSWHDKPITSPARKQAKQGMTTLLLLPDGRRVEHPEQVARGQFVDLDGGLYYVSAAAAGMSRASGETITLAVVSLVKP